MPPAFFWFIELITDFSSTDIRAVIVRPTEQLLAVLAYPGLVIQPNGMAAIDPERLEATFTALASIGCTTLYRLIEAREEVVAGEPAILTAAARHHIALVKLPIQDFSTPDPHTLHAIHNTLGREALDSSSPCIAVHCHAGAGRSGLVAAWLCMQDGLDSQQAIQWVRRAHPEAIETEGQVRWLQSQD